MKKYMIASLCFGFISILAGQKIVAQETTPVNALPPVTITSTHTKVPDIVWTNFHRYFTDAENPEWYEINRRFLVKYMTEDRSNQAVFTKKGSLVYNISFGSEKNLPDDLRKIVKNAYLDYVITRAVKVSQNNRTIWVVNVEDASKRVLVRLEDGEMEEIQNLRKS